MKNRRHFKEGHKIISLQKKKRKEKKELKVTTPTMLQQTRLLKHFFSRNPLSENLSQIPQQQRSSKDSWGTITSVGMVGIYRCGPVWTSHSIQKCQIENKLCLGKDKLHSKGLLQNKGKELFQLEVESIARGRMF